MFEPLGDSDRAVDSVMRAIDLVEERMGEDIGAQDMAAAACYSAFYFSRLFVRATGHAPYDYLMRRRVAAAAERIVSEDRSITDIALDCGFDVPDTFARAFRRCFGRLPSDARKDGGYARSIARTKIVRTYVEAMLMYGLPIAKAESAEDMAVEGEWLSAGEDGIMRSLAEGCIAVVERDEWLRPRRMLIGSRLPSPKPAERGTPAGPGAPAFPRCATLVAGGRRARFGSTRPEALSRVVEFAYRAWLPSEGLAAVPDYDLVEVEAGGGWSLLLPLRMGV